MDAPKLDALAYSKTEPQHHHAAFTRRISTPIWRLPTGATSPDDVRFARPHREEFPLQELLRNDCLCEHRGIDFACD